MIITRVHHRIMSRERCKIERVLVTTRTFPRSPRPALVIYMYTCCIFFRVLGNLAKSLYANYNALVTQGCQRGKEKEKETNKVDT